MDPTTEALTISPPPVSKPPSPPPFMHPPAPPNKHLRPVFARRTTGSLFLLIYLLGYLMTLLWRVVALRRDPNLDKFASSWYRMSAGARGFPSLVSSTVMHALQCGILLWWLAKPGISMTHSLRGAVIKGFYLMDLGNTACLLLSLDYTLFLKPGAGDGLVNMLTANAITWSLVATWLGFLVLGAIALTLVCVGIGRARQRGTSWVGNLVQPFERLNEVQDDGWD